MNLSKHHFDNIINEIKDYIFPIFCFGCGEEGVWVCEKCFEQINCSGVNFCPVCRLESKNGLVCDRCCSSSFLNNHNAVVEYDEFGLSGKIIHSLKYNFVLEILTIIEKLIHKYLENNIALFGNFDLIVPVPLYKKRLVERGFNQSELIANIFGKMINLPVQNILTRHKETIQQAKLNREERIENVKNAFVIVEGINVKDKNIIIVDDVLTTGSTLQECAKELRQKGAGHIMAFTLARG